MIAWISRSLEQFRLIRCVDRHQFVVVIVGVGVKFEHHVGVGSVGSACYRIEVIVLFLHFAGRVGCDVGVPELARQSVSHVSDLDVGVESRGQQIPIKHAKLVGAAGSFAEGLSREVDFVNVWRFVFCDWEGPPPLRDSVPGAGRGRDVGVGVHVPRAGSAGNPVCDNVSEIDHNFLVDES